ncbi:MAG: DUF4349 domain-containing protein [Sphingobacteriales bacterium]|nr:MAG: DUF4349 domain-containing protein [Sphingobacteriales bacterium]
MKRNIIAIAIIAGLFGCQNAKTNNESADVAEAKEIALAPITDTTATVKIIKTADMRFRVKDVQKTKEQLSKTIKVQGGSVAEFSIQSAILETDKVKLSADSSKEITSYRTDGFLIAKIPSDQLDDFTNTIAKMAVFVDNQSMKMDDQSLSYLANKIKAQNRVEAATQIGKIPSKRTGNIETALALKDDYADRKLDNMSIDAKVKYSTITLNFYQDNTVKTLVVANDRLADYRPGFANRFWLSIVNGWTVFMEIILALANLWMLIVFGMIMFFTIRYFLRKNKVAMELATKNLMDSAHK